MEKGEQQIAEQLDKELPQWDRLRCSECDAVVAYFSPEVKVHGDTLPVYCFQCAAHLDVKDN